MSRPSLPVELWRVLSRPFRGRPIRTSLVAWELGHGMGHIHRLLPLARALQERGHRIVFAFRSQLDAGAVAKAFPDTPVLVAPHFLGNATSPEQKKKPIYNYADLLFRCGYQDAATLAGLVAEWRALFASVQPNLVLCDHSPTAVLAAAGRIPVVHIGSGFATPPVGAAFPVLFSGSEAGAAEREAAVLAAINDTRRADGRPALGHSSELFAGVKHISCCLPELDPYASARAIPVTGPLARLPGFTPPAERDFVFAYLAGDDSRVLPLLLALAQARVRCSAFVRQAPAGWEEQLEGSSVHFFPGPQPLESVLRAATAVLHHGGLATTEMALAIGRAQFLLPRYLEQSLTADAIERMGSGVNLLHTKTHAGELIARALSRGTHDEAARTAAQNIEIRNLKDVGTQILAECMKSIERP